MKKTPGKKRKKGERKAQGEGGRGREGRGGEEESEKGKGSGEKKPSLPGKVGEKWKGSACLGSGACVPRRQEREGRGLGAGVHGR